MFKKQLFNMWAMMQVLLTSQTPPWFGWTRLELTVSTFYLFNLLLFL